MWEAAISDETHELPVKKVTEEITLNSVSFPVVKGQDRKKCWLLAKQKELRQGEA